MQEMLPVVTAEVVPPADQPQVAPWRLAPPPVRQDTDAPPARRPPEPPRSVPPAPEPTAAPDWRSAPPPSRTGSEAPAPPPPRRSTPPSRPTPPPRRPPVSEAAAPPKALPAPPPPPPPAPPPKNAGPVELPPGVWAPPPVRRGGDSSTAVTGTPPIASPDHDDHHEHAVAVATAKKKRNRLLMGVILTLLVLVLGGAGGAAWYVLRDTEERLARQAGEQYGQGTFHQATATYQKLIDQFGDSGNVEQYRFLKDLSETRAGESSPDVKGALDRVQAFLDKYHDDPRLEEYGKDIAQTSAKLVTEAAKRAKENAADKETQELFERGKKVRDTLLARDPTLLPPETLAAVKAVEDEAQALIEKARRREALLARLQTLVSQASAAAVKQLHDILKQEAASPDGFVNDPDVIKVANDVYAAHQNSIGFTQDQVVLPEVQGEDQEPGLIVQPLINGQASDLPADRVVFALARGVLYALRQKDGQALWTMRVGVDTAGLPIRLPPLGSRPEMALVQSADTMTLTALDARRGTTLWQYRLGSPALGRPVIIDRRAYVPTFDGQVHEIELAEGSLLGRYKLGPHLSLGGARMEGSRYVYFPADDYCVYVLDVANRRCHGILYTEHTAGSLRGEPIIVSTEVPGAAAAAGGEAPGFLVLSQTNGLDGMLLRTFKLPLAGPRATPEKMDEPRLRGWSWFPPYRDAEKLVMVTDAGSLGLFGIVQAQNQDSPLFPLVRVEQQPPGVVDVPGEVVGRGRAQVVHAQENDLWVLARGGLQRMVLTFDRKKGPKVVPHPLWSRPLVLGSPLHESQTDEAGTTLFVVTQGLNEHNCVMSAVDAETGRIHWQRQLGLVCQGDPLALGAEVLTLDQGGALFSFDPSVGRDDEGIEWRSSGKSLAKPLSNSAGGTLYLLPGPDGQSAYEIACPAPGDRAVIRHHISGRQGARAEVTVKLSAPLAGTPAIGANDILLLRSDGGLVRVPLPLEGGATLDDGATPPAPYWRKNRDNAAAAGHAVWLGGNDFATTNGRGGITHWRFQGKLWETFPPNRSEANPTTDIKERIVAAPVVLPRLGPNDPLQLVVADVQGILHLLEGDELKEVRQWDLKGKVTSGPFLRGRRIGCIVDRRKLVWVEPSLEGPAGVVWTYESPKSDIVGQPQLMQGSVVVVADESGRFIGLDARTGKPRGPGYVLKANVAPAASPVGFGPGRAFAPLTDGTVLLLSLEHLQQPLRQVPAAW